MIHKPYIFIAEDNKNDIFFLERIFNKDMLKYDVVIIDSVKQSIDFFIKCLKKQELPSVIILDIRLIDGSGFQILKYLKNNETLKSVPTIVMSSSDRIEDKEESIQLGANVYFEKIRTYKKLREKLPSLITKWAMTNYND